MPRGVPQESRRGTASLNSMSAERLYFCYLASCLLSSFPPVLSTLGSGLVEVFK